MSNEPIHKYLIIVQAVAFGIVLALGVVSLYKIGHNSTNEALGEALRVFTVTQGGTGTGVSPSKGYVLVGQTDGTYLAVATSTLGISAAGDGQSNWLYNGSRLSPSTTVGIGVFASSTISDLSMTNATATNLSVNTVNSVIYVPKTYTPTNCAASSTASTFDTCVEALVKQRVDQGASSVSIKIMYDVASASWPNTLDLNQSGVAYSLNCETGVSLYFGGDKNATTSAAIRVNNWNSYGHVRQDIGGCTLYGQNSVISAGQSHTSHHIGIFMGGGTGAVGYNVHDMTINGFGTQLEIGANAYLNDFTSNAFSGGYGQNGTGTGLQGSLIHINTAANSGERNVFTHNSFTDPANSEADNCFYIEQAGTASNFVAYNSFDDCQIRVLGSNGQTEIGYNHFENAAYSTYGEYIPVYADSAESNQITFVGNMFADSSNNAATNFDTLVKHGVNLYAAGNHLENYGGQTVTYFFDHSLNNGSSAENICGTSVQGGGLTYISRNWAYTQARAIGCHQNYANSYGTGFVANSDNTVDWKVGNNVNALQGNQFGDVTTFRDLTIGRALIANTSAGTSGYVLRSYGTGASPQWVATSTLGISGGTADGQSNWLYNGSRLSPSTTVGIGVFASSTIGNSLGDGGLTISGGATTTGNAYFGSKLGINTSSPYTALDVGGLFGAPSPFLVNTDPIATFSRTIDAPTGLAISNRSGGTSAETAALLFDTAGHAFGLRQAGTISSKTIAGYTASTTDFLTSSNGTARLMAIGTQQPSALALFASSTEALRISTNGFVGIGTTTPSRLLTVQGDGYFLNNVTAASSTFTDSTLGFASSTSLTVSGQTYLANASSTALTVSGNSFLGNVAIGTTTPSAAGDILSVHKPNLSASVRVDNTGKLIANGNLTTEGSILYTKNIIMTGQYFHNDSPDTAGVNYFNSAKFGIGTSTPAYNFTSTGTVGMYNLTVSAGTPSSICQNASTKEITVNAALTCTVSARDQKDNIKAFKESALAKVMRLTPSLFVYRDNYDRERFGFIADEVQAVDPLLGDAYKDGEARSIDLPALIALNTKAIQELYAMTGEAKKTAQDNWQWVALFALFGIVVRQQLQINKLK